MLPVLLRAINYVMKALTENIIKYRTPTQKVLKYRKHVSNIDFNELVITLHYGMNDLA